LVDTIKGYTRKWEVVEEYEARMVMLCVCIPRGFIFDGASIPKVFRGLLSPVGILLIPGMVHDFAYRYHAILTPGNQDRHNMQPITKKNADLIFLNLANEINGKRIINRIAYLAVKYFGHKAWNAGGTGD
jgi:hypothetical protein